MPDNDYMTRAEAAEFLHHKSQQTLHTDGCATGKHRFPFYRIGGKILYSRKELEAIIQSHRVATNQELRAEAEKIVNGK